MVRHDRGLFQLLSLACSWRTVEPVTQQLKLAESVTHGIAVNPEANMKHGLFHVSGGCKVSTICHQSAADLLVLLACTNLEIALRALKVASPLYLVNLCTHTFETHNNLPIYLDSKFLIYYSIRCHVLSAEGHGPSTRI